MREERSLPGPEQSQPVYVLPPGYYPPPYPEDDTINLAEYIRILWRRRYFILVGTLGCALAAYIITSLMPNVYQATATLMLVPPIFSTELKPAPLSVETYQSIVESDYIASKLREELVRKNIIPPDQGIGAGLETKIYTGKEKEQPYKPLIDLIVQADSPEKSAAIANVWADVFVSESAHLAGKGKMGTLEFIEREYPIAEQRLAQTESELKKIQDRYDRQIEEVENSFDAQIVEFKTRWNIDSPKRQLEALQQEFVHLVGQLHDVQLKIKHTRDTLDQLKQEIQAHPQFLTLSKAITTDALWEKVGKDFSGETGKELEALKLRTQELNPVYQNLLQRLADSQVSFDVLVPQERHLQDQIARRKTESEDLHQLILSKELELQKIVRKKETALALHKRERDFEVDALKREVETSRATYFALAQKYESARLAKAEEDQDVKIGAYAVASGGPVKPAIFRNTTVAFGVGLMLTILFSFFAESLGLAISTEKRPESELPGRPGKAALDLR